MKRKILAIMLTASMVVSMAIGCGKETETSAPVESATSTETKEAVTAVTFAGERSFTAVQGEAVSFSELVRKAEVKTGFTPETITIQYGETEFVMDTDKDLPKNEDGADVTVAMEKDAKTLMDKDNLPNITLTFADVTSKPETLTVQMDLAGSKDEEGTGEIEIPVTVVPKAVTEVKALTENLKVSESLDNYDFAVRASNIQNTLSEDSNIKSVAVKDSDVKFQTPGHYTVTYEVTFKEPIKVDMPAKEDTTDESNTADKTDTSETTDTAGGSDTTDESNTQDSSKDETVTEEVPSVDIPTDVTIVGKDETEDYDKDDIIDENIKPGDKVEISEDKEEASEDGKEDVSKDEDTSDDKGNSSESGNTSSGNTSSGGSSSSGGNTSSGGGSSSGGNSSSSSGGGSSSGGSSQPSQPVHVHNWVPKTHHIENWVTVSEHTEDYVCTCGYVTGSASDIQAHQKAHVAAGEASNFAIRPCSHTTQVDQGYDETYYVCSCGATK